METSDHVPCLVSISTKIPRKSIFRFENYWVEHANFHNVVQQSWVAPAHILGLTLTAKFRT
jgi:hypothetical protein